LCVREATHLGDQFIPMRPKPRDDVLGGPRIVIGIPRQPVFSIGWRESVGSGQVFVQPTIVERVQVVKMAEMTFRGPRVRFVPAELTVGHANDQLRHPVRGAAEPIRERAKCGDREIERPRAIKPFHTLNVPYGITNGTTFDAVDPTFG
jgi:hypothetical protein